MANSKENRKAAKAAADPFDKRCRPGLQWDFQERLR